MTKTERVLKSQLSAARAEIDDLYAALEEMKEREKIYLGRLRDQQGTHRKMTLADFNSPIDLEQVEAAL